jgi:hypothetical protein
MRAAVSPIKRKRGDEAVDWGPNGHTPTNRSSSAVSRSVQSQPAASETTTRAATAPISFRLSMELSYYGHVGTRRDSRVAGS